MQVHGDSVRGRILNGNSPCELIECFTETIGRPPLLPEWIISAAVVGMQGGTDTVRRVWDELKSYDVPISAFWLQVPAKKTLQEAHSDFCSSFPIQLQGTGSPSKLELY